MAVRKAHVEKVLDVGNRGGDVSRDMGPIAEIAMYGLMWSICKAAPGLRLHSDSFAETFRSQVIRRFLSQACDQLRCYQGSRESHAASLDVGTRRIQQHTLAELRSNKGSASIL